MEELEEELKKVFDEYYPLHYIYLGSHHHN